MTVVFNKTKGVYSFTSSFLTQLGPAGDHDLQGRGVQ